MHFLIRINEDGDTYKILPPDCNPEREFKKACEDDEDSAIKVIKVDVGVDFGFGAWGDFFGGEILFSRDSED